MKPNPQFFYHGHTQTGTDFSHKNIQNIISPCGSVADLLTTQRTKSLKLNSFAVRRFDWASRRLNSSQAHRSLSSRRSHFCKNITTKGLMVIIIVDDINIADQLVRKRTWIIHIFGFICSIKPIKNSRKYVCMIGPKPFLDTCIEKALKPFMLERFNHIYVRNPLGSVCQTLFTAMSFTN